MANDINLNSMTPQILRYGDHKAVIINFAAYKKLGPESQQQYRLSAVRAMILGSDVTTLKSMNEYALEIADDLRKSEQGGYPEGWASTHRFLNEDGQPFKTAIIKIDTDLLQLPKSVHFFKGQHVSEIKFDFSEKNNKYFQRYVAEHEAAHALYDLKEPGSDYMAVIKTLEKFPDSHRVLQLVADQRLMKFLLPINAEEELIKKYGYECSDAIKQALKDFEALKSISEPRKTEMMLIKAHEFDEKAMINAVKPFSEQPEIKVRQALENRIPGYELTVNGRTIENLFVLHSDNYSEIARMATQAAKPGNLFSDKSFEHQTPQDLVDVLKRIGSKVASIAGHEGVFKKESVEHHILSDFGEAMKRVAETGYGESVPNLSPQLEPAAASPAMPKR